MWLRLDRSITKIGREVVIGFVYQPPESSKYFTADEAELFDVELISIGVFDWSFL